MALSSQNEKQHTPMMQQYLGIKAKYPDMLLFYRMGDFYELFFEDAEKTSKILEITLTARGQTAGKPIPMAGVPFHAAESYIAKLLRHGFSIAICEQVGEVKPGAGPVKREVVQILTPGTVTDAAFLQSDLDNLLMAISGNALCYGIATLDLSAGHFHLLEVSGEQSLLSEIARLNPVEILISDNWEAKSLSQYSTKIKTRMPWEFDYDTAVRLLTTQMQTHDLKAYGCEHLRQAICAAGSLLQYAQQTQKRALPHLKTIKVDYQKEILILDASTRKNLEILNNLSGGEDYTLAKLLDHTKTSMGSRLIKRWLINPIKNIDILQQRQQAIGELIENQQYAPLQSSLKKINDLERILSRIALKTARPRDLVGVRETLNVLPTIITEMEFFSNEKLKTIKQDLIPFPAVLTKLSKAIKENPSLNLREGGVIAEGYDQTLDELRRLSHDVSDHLLAFEQSERRNTGYSTLKVGYNRVHGYYIEISKLQAKVIPSYYIRRQTLKNAERYTTPELKAFEDKALSAKEHALMREKFLYETLLESLLPDLPKLQKCAQALAEIDVYSNLAERAIQLKWCCPRLSASPKIEIEAGRHPVIEVSSTEAFIPNDTFFNAKERIFIITGPNMGGKSTYMRQVALIVLLTHIGSFVPAKAATIGPVDRIFTRIGASDDLASGRSTFMVEMTETAQILHHATENSLVLMDEVGRGTSTFDGLSLAYAAVHYLAKKLKSFTLFATHYFELTELADELEGVQNMHLDATEFEDQLIFLHALKKGRANQSYGIQVAKLAGIPHSVIEDAKEKLTLLEQKKETMPFKQIGKQVSDKPHPLIAAMQNLEIDDLTPKAALALLYEWKHQLKT